MSTRASESVPSDSAVLIPFGAQKPRSIGDVVFACCLGMLSWHAVWARCIGSAVLQYCPVRCGAQALAEVAPEVRVYLDEESVLHHRLARIAARFTECAEARPLRTAQQRVPLQHCGTAVADPT